MSMATTTVTAATTGDDSSDCDTKPTHAVAVTPVSFASAEKRSSSLSSSPMDNSHPKEATSPSKETTTCNIVIPTDRDVLCGRGKGIRRHAGNEFYNKLLREHYDEYKAVPRGSKYHHGEYKAVPRGSKHYDEYKAVPKGSKILIVKKIVSFVREGQVGGEGRFLERIKQKKQTLLQAPANEATDGNDSRKNNDNGTWSYIDIGDERAMNKTAQGFRDIRVTMEKIHSIAMRTTSEEKKNSASSNNFDSGSVGKVATSTATTTATGQHRTKGSTRGGDDDVEQDGQQNQKQQQQQQTPRRPTFRERLAMLERQQQQREDQSSDGDDDDEGEENENSSDDDSSEESVNNKEEEIISDTETEESFQMYSLNKKSAPTKH